MMPRGPARKNNVMILDYGTKPFVRDRKVRGAFRKSGNLRRAEGYQFTWEHGQWWVIAKGTGRTWVVVDTNRGLDFELIEEGGE